MPMGRKKKDGDRNPHWVCFVDKTGFYFGERDTIGYLLTDPKSAMQNEHEEDPCECGDADCEECGDLDDEPTWENPNSAAFEGLLDGSDPDTAVLMKAHDQQHLWAIFRKLAKEFKRNMGSSMQDSMIFIHMPCGKIIVYKCFDDVPKRNVLCTCGAEYVIRYTGLSKEQ